MTQNARTCDSGFPLGREAGTAQGEAPRRTGPMICGLLDQSSGIEDILVNEDCRIWVKRTGSAFEHIGELASRQSRGAMMTIASMQKTTVTEGKPVLESQLPIWKYRFAG